VGRRDVTQRVPRPVPRSGDRETFNSARRARGRAVLRDMRIADQWRVRTVSGVRCPGRAAGCAIAARRPPPCPSRAGRDHDDVARVSCVGRRFGGARVRGGGGAPPPRTCEPRQHADDDSRRARCRTRGGAADPPAVHDGRRRVDDHDDRSTRPRRRAARHGADHLTAASRSAIGTVVRTRTTAGTADYHDASAADDRAAHHHGTAPHDHDGASRVLTRVTESDPTTADSSAARRS
jgi:hypothetical protein